MVHMIQMRFSKVSWADAGYAALTEDTLLLDAGAKVAKDPYQQLACRGLIVLS